MAVKKIVNRKKMASKTSAQKAQEPKVAEDNKFSDFFAKLKYKMRNTIMSTILFVILIFISILLIIHAFSINTIISNKMQREENQRYAEKITYILKKDTNILNDVNYLAEQKNKNLMQDIVNEINDVLKNNYDNDSSSLKVNDIQVKNIIIVDKYGLNKIKEKDTIDKKTIEENGAIVITNFVGDSYLDRYLIKQFKASKNQDNRYLFKEKNPAQEKFIRLGPVLDSKEIDNRFRYQIYLCITKKSGNFSSPELITQINAFEKMFFAIIMLLSIFLVYMLARSVSLPIVKMEKSISKIAEGDLSGRLEYTNYDELNQLVKSYNAMANSLQRLYSTLEKQVQDRTQELKSAYAELQSTQAMMVHSEKMKSLGELVAGIMHEINNPINFIYGNMTHLSNYSNDLINIIDEYTKYNDSLKPEEKTSIENLKSEIDYEFLKTDLPDLIKSCKEGADRAKNIIQDLKSFSRMEEAAIADVDLNREIDTVLNILHNKIKNKAEVHKEYDPNSIPAVEAFGGQLNQVFMNILDNAVGAIQEHGDIWIRMNKDNIDKNVIIEIEDNGMGMDAETAEKVFNPFFTTKPVGQGTGLGMSITYKIIKNHQGDIRVESKKGVGSKFIITLPINLNRDALNAGVENGENNG